MKSKTISIILSMLLMGGLGAGQNITIVDNGMVKGEQEAEHITIEALFLGDICLGTSFGN